MSAGELLLIVHFAWALWMVAGVVLALAGYIWRRLWTWAVFRTAHLIGVLATATVPFWAEGVCPLTRWESELSGGEGAAEPFLVYWLRELLYWDIDPFWLSVLAGIGATATLAIYMLHPPWRERVARSN